MSRSSAIKGQINWLRRGLCTRGRANEGRRKAGARPCKLAKTDGEKAWSYPGPGEATEAANNNKLLTSLLKNEAQVQRAAGQVICIIHADRFSYGVKTNDRGHGDRKWFLS